jgi:hypothetical protein
LKREEKIARLMTAVRAASGPWGAEKKQRLDANQSRSQRQRLQVFAGDTPATTATRALMHRKPLMIDG